MFKAKILLFVCALFGGFSLAVAQSRFIPKNGFVPDKATAVKVAEAILVPIYGADILKQRPFKAGFYADRWIVEGTFPVSKGRNPLGGVAVIEIHKTTGEILRVTHGK